MDTDRVSKCFFTVTLCKDLLDKKLNYQLRKSYGDLFRVCMQVFIKFEFVYELTTKGNAHYHGIGTVPKGDEHKFYAFQDLLKGRNFGFFKVDIINKDNGTAEYVCKSIGNTEAVCKYLKIDLSHYPIICTHETKLKKDRFIIKPLKNISTVNLDILETISEYNEITEKGLEEIELGEIEEYIANSLYK